MGEQEFTDRRVQSEDVHSLQRQRTESENGMIFKNMQPRECAETKRMESNARYFIRRAISNINTNLSKSDNKLSRRAVHAVSCANQLVSRHQCFFNCHGSRFWGDASV